MSHSASPSGGAIRLAVLAAAFFAAVAIITPATSSASSAPSSAHRASVVHRSPYWSWTRPADWTASYGTYGTTIQGPSSAFALGFSSILCTPASSAQASAQRYFAGQRRLLAKDVRILGKTKIKTVPRVGPNYFRQTVNI